MQELVKLNLPVPVSVSHSGEYQRMRAECDYLRVKHAAIQKNIDTVNQHYRKRNSDLVTVLNDVLAEINSLLVASDSDGFEPGEEPRIPEERLTKENKAEVKKIYRRVAMLCHEDRIKKYDNEVQEKLRVIFFEAKDAYTYKDLDVLYVLLEAALSLRTGSGDTSKVTDYIRSMEKRMRSVLIAEQEKLQRLSETPGFALLMEHINRNYRECDALYRAVMQQEIDRQRQALMQLRSRVFKRSVRSTGDAYQTHPSEPELDPNGMSFVFIA